MFFYHGYEKLTRSSQDALEAFAGLGLPSYAFYVIGTLELFGAILLALGLLTRFTALLLAIEMQPERGDVTHELMLGIPLNIGEFEA